MKKAIYSLLTLAILIAGVAYADCGSKQHSDTEAGKIAPGSSNASDIVVTAIESGKFSMLVAALKAANMVETLKGDGPYTVFAPTDKAFAELPDGALDALLNDPKKLAAVLKYHVVPGVVTADEVGQIKSAKTLNGQTVAITSKDDQVMINGAHVIGADIMCRNGVIHVVDKVILPTEEAR
jgi:uncharacterized surface protein with fasciclin (FAS1) repeats